LQKELVLTESQKQILIKHTKKNNPNESCAILFGSIIDEKNIVQDIFLTDNVEDSPVKFIISNEQLIKAYQTAEDKNLDVVGIFHSHPNSDPYPSENDKKFLQVNPIAWIIFSGITHEFKAYVLEKEILQISVVVR